MATSVYGNATDSGYNDVSVEHTAAWGDNFAIVVTWQHLVGDDEGHYPDTPGAPTYGGDAMTYVDEGANYSLGTDMNNGHAGVWMYVLHGIKAGTQTVTFTPTAGHRGSLGVITGRWINPIPEDTGNQDNMGGGSYSITADPVSAGAFVVCAGTGAGGPSGDGTTAWSWFHDEEDNRWDTRFWGEYFIAPSAGTKTFDALFGGGTVGLVVASFPARVLAGIQVIRVG